MAGVNAYGSYGNKVNGYDSDGNRVAKSDNNLNMDDFLKLLTAQMSNQDMMNPTTDMEFIGQMAQFTTLQAMKTLTELSMAQHGSSMVGKYVVVAHIDDRGELVEAKGQVTNVEFLGGVVSVTVNGKQYEMSSIMEVMTKEEFDKPPPVDTDKDGIPDEDEDDDGDGVKNKDDPDYVKPPATVIPPVTPPETTPETDETKKVSVQSASAYQSAQVSSQAAQATRGIDPVTGFDYSAPIEAGVVLDYNQLKADGQIYSTADNRSVSVQAAEASRILAASTRGIDPVTGFDYSAPIEPGVVLDYNQLKANGQIYSTTDNKSVSVQAAEASRILAASTRGIDPLTNFDYSAPIEPGVVFNYDDLKASGIIK